MGKAMVERVIKKNAKVAALKSALATVESFQSESKPFTPQSPIPAQAFVMAASGIRRILRGLGENIPTVKGPK